MARILIIDDNLDMLTMLKMMLEKRGSHQVIISSNGQDGLEKALAEKFDIAIIDVMMPGLSGYDVVRKLRANPDTEHLGIIILTARGQPVDRHAALSAGADDHMAKPVDMERLTTLVSELIERKQKAKQAAKQKVEKNKAPVAALFLPVFSLKGGVGVTSLAVNMATILQQIAPTILLDLSPNSGHCALNLGLRPEKHWGHYLEKPETPIDTFFLQHRSGLRLLAAPPLPLKYGWFSDEAIATTLAQLKPLARFVVVDMPPVLNPTAKFVLSKAHRIILVCEDDPPSLQTTLATVQILQEWKDHIMLVRNMRSATAHPPAESVQRALRTPLTADVPYDPAQGAALRKGTPLAALQQKTPLVTGLMRVVQILLKR